MNQWCSPWLPSAEALTLPALALTHSPERRYQKVALLSKKFQCCGGQHIFYSGL